MSQTTRTKLHKLTKKQKGFVNDYLETGNGSLAAKGNYNVSTDESARAIASQNLTKPAVVAYLEENAQTVASNIVHLALNAENEGVQLAAGKDVLDRAGYKPVEKSVSVNFQIPIENRQYVESVAQKAIEQMKHGEN